MMFIGGKPPVLHLLVEVVREARLAHGEDELGWSQRPNHPHRKRHKNIYCLPLTVPTSTCLNVGFPKEGITITDKGNF